MKFEKTKVFNFEGAIRGMRNPLESWDHSDSFFGIIDTERDFPYTDISELWVDEENIIRRERGQEELSYDMEDYNEYYNYCDKVEHWLTTSGLLSKYGDYADVAFLGPNDLHLAQRLVTAGDEHAKFMRQIIVSVDITAPLYWWKEFDTYKVGTVANSTSTMHKLSSSPIDINCFEIDDMERNLKYNNRILSGEESWVACNGARGEILNYCEELRLLYLETKDERYWKELIRWLPESWLQTRTITMSYANIRNMYNQRKGHKLSEWHQFCEWINTLPYSNELITY